MNTHPAIFLLQQHTPLPAEGSYDAKTYTEIGEALSRVPNCPPHEAIPALLNCADADSDPSLLAEAAVVLAAFPADLLEAHLQTLPSRNVPTVWLLAIVSQVPQIASREHLERLREEEANEELRDLIDAELESFPSEDHNDEIDSEIERFKRQNKLPRICKQADQAMRNQAFPEVVRILSSYQDILPPIYQKKLEIAKRKSS